MRRAARRQDDRAVAPVVAEILLVAMTVTLAATLFYVASNLSSQANIASHPFVAFGATQLQDGNATIPIDGVSAAVSAENYKVNLEVGTTMGSPADLAAGGKAVTVTVGGTAYHVRWQDVAGDGLLNAGDPITISAAGAPLPSGIYSFFLIWSDGSVVQSAVWTV